MPSLSTYPRLRAALAELAEANDAYLRDGAALPASFAPRAALAEVELGRLTPEDVTCLVTHDGPSVVELEAAAPEAADLVAILWEGPWSARLFAD